MIGEPIPKALHKRVRKFLEVLLRLKHGQLATPDSRERAQGRSAQARAGDVAHEERAHNMKGRGALVALQQRPCRIFSCSTGGIRVTHGERGRRLCCVP